jgi:hypothetical protein
MAAINFETETEQNMPQYSGAVSTFRNSPQQKMRDDLEKLTMRNLWNKLKYYYRCLFG